MDNLVALQSHAPTGRQRPVREGLFQLQPPRLLGSRCEACGAQQFPGRSFCPSCRAQGGQAPAVLGDRGIVFSFTVVHQSPLRSCPYVLALVDLHDRVRVLARLDVPADAPYLGMPVKLAIERIDGNATEDILGYVFVADAHSEGKS